MIKTKRELDMKQIAESWTMDQETAGRRVKNGAEETNGKMTLLRACGSNTKAFSLHGKRLEHDNVR